MPFASPREDHVHHLQHLADPLELGESFAIVAMLALAHLDRDTSHSLKLYSSAAYGAAASVALDVAVKPIPNLGALVAYCPQSTACARLQQNRSRWLCASAAFGPHSTTLNGGQQCGSIVSAETSSAPLCQKVLSRLPASL